jgi:hypothetical protein
VRFGAARVHRCGVGGEADAAVGADVVAAGGSFPTVEAVSNAYGPASGSLALPRPSWDHSCCCRGHRRVALNLLPRSLPDAGVVHTRGDGTRVPSVMAP